MSCPAPTGPMPLPCVGLEGSPPYQVFVLDLNDFDVPPGYVGVDGRAAGHIVVEARPHDRSPSKPCVGGRALAPEAVGGVISTVYTCPPDSDTVQREATHGEGAYTGHLVLAWSRSGTDYIVSAHGPTTANLALLGQLLASVALVAPGANPGGVPGGSVPGARTQ